MEHEAVDLETQRVESNALQTTNQASRAITHGSQWALARMTDDEFTQVMEMAKKGRERIQTAQRALMKPAVHFYSFGGDGKPGGKPGDKQSLSKAGAEVLRQMFRLIATTESKIEYGDGVTSPAITVTTKCHVHADSADGPVVGTGEGACTSWERKYRYRRGDRTCPACAKTGTIIKGKAEYGGGWICFGKKGGCGAKWPDGAAEIESQVVGDIENPDQFDLLNTIVKMAEKRAKVDATIDATGSSDLFTQDVEDMPGMVVDHGPEDPDAWRDPSPAPAPARKRAPSAVAEARKTAASIAPSSENGPALQLAKKGFLAMVERLVRAGKLDEACYANSDAGRARRLGLLCDVMGSPAVEPGDMSVAEWIAATNTLAERYGITATEVAA